jgi:hypothetical protein
VTVKRNLILAYKRDYLDPEDFRKIAHHVTRINPEIDVCIVDSDVPSLKTAVKLANWPTLLVSPTPLRGFMPARGRIFCGYPMSKQTQLTLLRAAGVPVPEWEIISPEREVDVTRFDEIVVVKPASISSYGRGVELRQTRNLRYRSEDEYPPGHPGRLGPMLAQKFIDTGPRLSKIRVLTLFGEPLYAEEIKTESEVSLDLGLSDEQLRKQSIIVIDRPRVRSFVYETDVLDLARRIFRAAPMIPIQGCDIIREHRTGALYALEFNPGGNTWHFSSKAGRTQVVEGKKRETQFDAFRVAGEVLAKWVLKAAL